jgi:hypothetical protein
MEFAECARLATAAGLLVGGEVLASNLHGPPPRQRDSDEEYASGEDYGGDFGCEVHESSFDYDTVVREATGDFQCSGWEAGRVHPSMHQRG